MEEKVIRTLRADEIECRIGTISEKGVSLLLYKDARADMKILDEVYGSMNWQREHVVVGGNLYCIVRIWDTDKKQWISKMDVGTESNTEKEKGQASDSFKRACVSLGIGRELYTAPFIWISAKKVKIEKKPDNNGKEKLFTYDKFSVTSIEYNDKREIIGLTIINQNGNVVYCLKENAGNVTSENEEEAKADGAAISIREAEIGKELTRTGVALDAVLKRYGVTCIQEMDEDTYKKAMNGLKKTKAKVA